METWRLSRAGVINFWYYDEETFHFEDGRLLLRGSNGSGKSVTMQSLVPLLFDGNKSPERLDPFGSKARKMESYLLSDGLDLEERTGYLFLEFEKAEAGRYITVGMGMRARKNAPMQTWYFIVLDNRRIGMSHDFTLYKDMGDKIPLTQKELENKIAQGGYVYTKQSEYKRAVNEHLFGYSELSDFDELITLLIQIRSPKLSKEFKPTTMYEIMQNSLVTLTDEDLRPMSEAIENMDEIKLRIDALEASKRSLSKIQTSYDKYNTFMLANKAKRFTKYAREKKENEDEKAKHLDKKGDSQARILSIAASLTLLEDEEIKLKQRETSLKKHDLSQLAEEGDTLKTQLRQYEEVFNRKNIQLERETDKERALNTKIREKQTELDAIETSFSKHLEVMAEEAEVAAFEEFAFLKHELTKQKAEISPFKYHKIALAKYAGAVKETLKALVTQEEFSARYDEALKNVEVCDRELERQKRTVLESERQFNEVKAEFAEKAFKWSEENNEFKPARDVLSKVVERIYAYHAPYRYDEAIDPLYTAYEQFRQAIESERLVHVGEKANYIKSIDVLEQRFKETQAQKDPEPIRSQAVIQNRLKLAEKNIPHLPLYKAIDYAKETPEALKEVMEEALEAMGLLDALLVAPEHRDIVEKMDAGHADKYIFASPEFLSHNLSQILKVDEQEQTFSKNDVEEVLMSILLNPSDQKFYVHEDGVYGMGILKGKVSGSQPARFIGQSARKRYKEALLSEIREEINGIKNQLRDVEQIIVRLEARKTMLETERHAFPGKIDLDTAYQEVSLANQELSYKLNEEKRLRTLSEEIYNQLKAVRLQVAEVSKGLYLTRQVDVYLEADEALGTYTTELNALEHQYAAQKHTLELLQTHQEQLAVCLEQLDAIRYDLEQNDRARMRAKLRLEDIQNQLSASDFAQIQREYEQCQLRLNAVPSERNALYQERSDLNAGVARLSEQIERIDIEQVHVIKMYDLYEKAFLEEHQLGYVDGGGQNGSRQASPLETKEQDMADVTTDYVPNAINSLELAKAVLKSHSAILDENKTIIEYNDVLKEKFIRESSELSEYHLKINYLFRDLCDEACSGDDISHIERADLVAKVQGKPIKFHELSQWIDSQIIEQSSLLSEQDRMLFEEILINSISKKISGKIYHSEEWVKKIDDLMNGMDTSSGLSFHLKWVTKEAEHEEQLSTKELVGLLRGDQALLTRDQKDRLIRHFQSKIAQSKLRLEDASDNRSFLAIMKEILDYRKWFQFQLFYTKKGEKRRELTNNAFFTFSGGEKAMAMYVPLFSAVYAKYSGARKDCPKLVSLDEAFAGVDERNITDMFRLLVKELDLGFIANSQVLFGDYETVPALSIYELIRPENATFVTTIRYKWNGHTRVFVEPTLE